MSLPAYYNALEEDYMKKALYVLFSDYDCEYPVTLPVEWTGIVKALRAIGNSQDLFPNGKGTRRYFIYCSKFDEITTLKVWAINWQRFNVSTPNWELTGYCNTH